MSARGEKRVNPTTQVSEVCRIPALTCVASRPLSRHRGGSCSVLAPVPGRLPRSSGSGGAAGEPAQGAMRRPPGSGRAAAVLPGIPGGSDARRASGRGWHPGGWPRNPDRWCRDTGGHTGRPGRGTGSRSGWVLGRLGRSLGSWPPAGKRGVRGGPGQPRGCGRSWRHGRPGQHSDAPQRRQADKRRQADNRRQAGQGHAGRGQRPGQHRDPGPACRPVAPPGPFGQHHGGGRESGESGYGDDDGARVERQDQRLWRFGQGAEPAGPAQDQPDPEQDDQDEHGPGTPEPDHRLGAGALHPASPHAIFPQQQVPAVGTRFDPSLAARRNAAAAAGVRGSCRGCPCGYPA